MSEKVIFTWRHTTLVQCPIKEVVEDADGDYLDLYEHLASDIIVSVRVRRRANMIKLRRKETSCAKPLHHTIKTLALHPS
jgi:hypothetical protein